MNLGMETECVEYKRSTSEMRESENRSNPWDSRSSDTPVSAVDEKALRRYVERGVEAKRIPFSYTEPTDVLSRLGLLCEDGMLTNAAAVCFVPSKDIMLKMGVSPTASASTSSTTSKSPARSSPWSTQPSSTS